MGEYGGIDEHSFDQSHCSSKILGGFLPIGSKITDMTHMERKARLVTCIGKENI